MKKTVFSKSGRKIEIDISDEACSEFGFKHGARIVHPNLGKGTVEGVGHVNGCTDVNVLWYKLDVDEGVSFSYPKLVIKAVEK
ncbi:MAG: hypothetical protein ACLFNO_02275 [Parcubacteria group bacterium]